MALKIVRFLARRDEINSSGTNVFDMTVSSRDVLTPERRALLVEYFTDPAQTVDTDELPEIAPGRWIGGIAVVSVKQSDDTPFATCH